MPKPQRTPASKKSNHSPEDNEANYSTTSEPDPNESKKRMHHHNGKFSIQRFIRQGLASWRARRKLPSMSTPGPFVTHPSTPPLSPGRFVSNQENSSSNNPTQLIPNSDSSEEHNSSFISSMDSSNKMLTTADQRPITNRGFIQSPWANNSAIRNNDMIEETNSRTTRTAGNRVVSWQMPDTIKASDHQFEEIHADHYQSMAASKSPLAGI